MHWTAILGALFLCVSAAAGKTGFAQSVDPELKALLLDAGVDLPNSGGDALKLELLRKLDPAARLLTAEEAAASSKDDAPLQEAELWPRGMLYVKMPALQEGAYKELVEALDAVSNAPVSGIILDLRGADGRNEAEAQRLASLFLPEGTPICRILAAGGGYRRTLTASGDRARIPESVTVILVDGKTGGLAEMLAGALSKRNGIFIIGRPTSGFSAVRRLVELGDGRQLLIAAGWADWGGGARQKLVPDFTVPEDLPGTEVPKPRRVGRQSPDLTELLGLTADDSAARLAADFILSQIRTGKRLENESTAAEN